MPPLAIVVTLFLVLMVLRTPVAFAIGIATLVGIWISPVPLPLTQLPSMMWQGVNSFLLLAIPFFLLLGNLALVSGVTKRLINLAMALVGHVSGGLAHVGVLTNMIMAGMSGSDLADAAATGTILIPMMKRVGYPVAYAASIISGAATIGPLIPPSIPFVIFAAATDTSVGRLFLGGAIPGVLLGLLLMLQAYVVAKRHNYPRSPHLSLPERARAIGAGLPVLLVPVIVLGGILGGVATPTEAAVLGVLAITLLGAVVYRELSLKSFTLQLLLTLQTAATIFFILATAIAFARVLTLYGAAAELAKWITGLTNDPVIFLLGINVVYLFLGCLLESVPIMLVFVPLLMPTVNALGIDHIHFGVITVFNLLIGLMTPPYGLQMYLLCRIANISILEFWRYVWPVFLTMVVTLLITTLYPPLTTALPNLVLPLR